MGLEDRLIDAHAMNSAFGIDARIIEVLACIQTHQIGGSFESGTPVTDDVMATCRHQYSLSFISALMARDGNKQLQTRQLGGEKLNCRSLIRLQDPADGDIHY